MEIWQKDLLEVLRDIIQRIPGSYIYDIDRSKVVKQIDLWREQVGNVAKPNAVMRSNATTGWIRTGKIIPKHEQIVDIFFEGTRFTDCMFCDYKDSTPIHFYDGRYDRIIELEDVEFWMPLPEPPEV